MTTYGGNFDEWGIGCPDGEGWPETAPSKAQARRWLATADEDCCCGQSPHVLIWRQVPEWETAP